MKIGDRIHGGIYAGTHNGHHVICSLKEYESPVKLNWNKANEYCQELGMTLPTKEELNLLYELYKLVPEQFSTTRQSWHWSSTEGSLTFAWAHGFSNGSQGYNSKSLRSYVRAVRRVKI